MADAGSRRRTGHGGPTGIGKQIEYLNRPPGTANFLHDKIPVDRLFGKQARMLKIHGLNIERQLSVLHRPLLRKLAPLPMPAAGIGPEITGIRVLPGTAAPGRFPYGLGVRAHQDLPSPALQFLAIATVQQFIILPILRDPHRRSFSLILSIVRASYRSIILQIRRTRQRKFHPCQEFFGVIG